MKGAGGGRPSKPASERRNRNKPTHETVVLPAEGREGDPPVSPLTMRAPAKRLYESLWTSPMATQWSEQDAAEVATYCILRTLKEPAKGQLEEARQLADRYGLSAYSRRQLRWVIEGEEPESEDGEDPKARDRRHLRPVDPSVEAG